MDRIYCLYCFIFLGQCAIRMTHAGECCKTTIGELWCSNICCDSGAIQCCNNRTFQAPIDYRSMVCVDFFRATIWGPMIVCVVSVLVLLFCCFCFYRCRCGNEKEPPLKVPPIQLRHRKAHASPLTQTNPTDSDTFVFPRPSISNYPREDWI